MHLRCGSETGSCSQLPAACGCWPCLTRMDRLCTRDVHRSALPALHRLRMPRSAPSDCCSPQDAQQGTHARLSAV